MGDAVTAGPTIEAPSDGARRSRIEIVAAVVSGSIFGTGLLVSGMAEPARVRAFLDPLGAWDPSLALVMVGAITFAFLGFRLARARGASASGPTIDLSSRKELTPSLVIGSALFGIGWGLVGLCPGPAFVALGAGHVDAILFLVAMMGGAGLVDLARWRREPEQDLDRASDPDR